MARLVHVRRHVCGRLGWILLKDTMEITRLGLVVGSFLWAYHLLVPVDVFPTAEEIAAGTGYYTYGLMASFASAKVWGILFLFHALCASYTLFSGIRNRAMLLMDGVLGCVLWTGATIACLMAAWPIILPGSVVMAFYSWWHMVRYWAEEPRLTYDIDETE